MPAALNKRLGLTEQELVDLFRHMYESMSQSRIAARIGCDITVVEKWFKRGNILVRSQSEKMGLRFKRHVDLSTRQIEILNGLLLSDFHLEQSVFQARFSFGFKHIEFAQAIIQELSGLQWSKPRQNSHTGCWHAKSKFFANLIDWRNKWYSQHKKVVPNDLVLTPETLYWWYLGDGRVDDYGLTLCTESFETNENESLVRQLAHLGIQAHRTPSNRIRIRSAGVTKFIAIIGSPRVSCYSYKWYLRLKKRGNSWIQPHMEQP